MNQAASNIVAFSFLIFYTVIGNAVSYDRKFPAGGVLCAEGDGCWRSRVSA